MSLKGTREILRKLQPLIDTVAELEEYETVTAAIEAAKGQLAALTREAGDLKAKIEADVDFAVKTQSAELLRSAQLAFDNRIAEANKRYDEVEKEGLTTAKSLKDEALKAATQIRQAAEDDAQRTKTMADAERAEFTRLENAIAARQGVLDQINRNISEARKLLTG